MSIGDLDIDNITRGKTDDSDSQFDVLEADDVSEFELLEQFTKRKRISSWSFSLLVFDGSTDASRGFPGSLKLMKVLNSLMRVFATSESCC